jgi:transcriptional regulator with XRE-family HTH domain
MSQDDVAYGAGVSRSYLSQIENGEFYVSIRVIGDLSKFMGIDPAEFFQPTVRPRKPKTK